MAKVSEIDKESRLVASRISNPSVPVKDAARMVISFMKKPKCGQEPYAALVRFALDLEKNGRNAISNINSWTLIFDRLESVVHIVNRKGSLFAKTIMNESIAHRYADLAFLHKSIEYEEKMVKHYKMSYDAAVEYGLLKNIDSTMFWTAVCYHRLGKLDLAKKYYSLVANRQGPRFHKSYLFQRKLVLSKIYADPRVILEQEDSIDLIISAKNPKYIDFYKEYNVYYNVPKNDSLGRKTQWE